MTGSMHSLGFDIEELGVLLALADTQTFVTPGADTWTKPSLKRGVLIVTIMAGGGGGGSGRFGNAGSIRGGGGSGANGSPTYHIYYLDEVAGTEPVVVGAGGVGGALVSGAPGPGIAGTDGGDSSFGIGRALGGGGGGGGTSSGGGSAGAGNFTSHKGDPLSSPPGVPRFPAFLTFGGLSGGNGVGVLGDSIPTPHGPSAGGRGAGVTAGDAEQAGSAGGAGDNIYGTTVAGGAGGSVSGGAGGAGGTGSTSGGGAGGGGGGSSAASGTPGGAGGDAGDYGAGGGGGGAGTHSGGAGSSGKGGDGSDGIVIVRTYGA